MESMDVLSAVCAKLHKSFPDICIHKELLADDFSEPCFFVWCSNVELRPRQGFQFSQEYSVEVTYFANPKAPKIHSTLLKMGVRLCEILFSIELLVGDHKKPVWALNPNFQILDGDALQFSVRFRIDVLLEEPVSPLMDMLGSSLLDKE